MKTFTNLIKCASLSTFNKKRYYLFIIMLLTLGIGSAWGAETLETISYSNHKGNGTSSTGSAYTMNGDKFSITDSKFYCDATKTYAQFYANSTITITPNTGVTIKNIVITASSSSYNGFQSSGTFTSSIGSVTKTDDTHITWAGSATSEFTISHNKQIRWTAIEVTYEETTSGGGENPGEGGGGEDPDSGEETSATMTAGTNGTACTVNEKDGIKVGTSKKGGDMQITVPAGATMLHVYAAAWNGVTSLSLNITPTSNVTTTSITLTADAGIANNTPFTLSGNEADYLFDIPLQNITAETTLTFTSSVEKRFVVWGATYETASGDDPEPVIVKTLESIAVTGMTTTFEQGDVFKFDGTCTATYSVTKDGAAQADEKTEVTPTNVSTPDMNQIGTQTVYVTYSEGGVEKTYDYKITITENTVTAGEYCITPNNEFWGTNFNGSLSGEALDQTYTGRQDDITIQYAKGSSQYMYINDSQTRVYGNNSLTFSVPSGYVITAIAFTADGTNWKGTHTSNVGSMTDSKNWAGSAKEVTITFGDNCRVTKICVTYEELDLTLPSAPTFNPEAGTYNTVQNVTISAEAGTTIYYTLDGTDPTTESNVYSTPIEIAETKTLKAIAVKDEKVSPVASATYTIKLPLTTMDQIFAKATAVGSTATSVEITFGNWVVTGVKNNNAYLTDGTKGLIIYTASHGFNVGDILSGTVACKVQLYNGSSELTELTSTTEGLTVTTGGVVTPVEVTDITTLGGVNTGSVIKITGPCKVDGTKYYVAGVQLYNSLYTYTNPEDGYNYECTGVYLQYNTTKEILPRKAEDLVKIETQQPAGIKFETTEYTANVNEAFTAPTLTNPYGLTVTYSTSDATLATVNTNTGAVTIGNKTGKVTITASFAGNEDYVAATASYNITISDPSLLEATFDATEDLGNTARGEGSIAKSPITFACSDGILGNASEYRLYKDAKITFTAENGYAITKVVLTSTASGTSDYGPAHLSTEEGTYSYSDKTGTWVGEAQTVTLTATAQSRAKLITVYYKVDNRQDAGLAWSTESVSITLGDAFTAPTLSNPNGLTLTCTSDNEDLATVSNAGVITLKSSVTGKATITAKFDGNSNYKDAKVSCTITVNPKTETVVILAQYNGQWYALKNVEQTAGKVLAALPVNYVGGKLYNVEEADKATIEWQRAAVTDGIIFKNGENYIYGTAGSTDLKLSTTECAWTLDGSTYKIGNRTFIYRAQANGFKNYNATTTPGTDDYSNLPVVTAPVYATGDAYGRSVNLGEDGYRYGTICLPFGSTNFTGAEFFECVGKEEGKVYLGSVTTLEAGVPYIFKATATEVAVYGNGTTAATPGSKNGLVGTFTNDTEVAIGNYILKDNALCQAAAICWVNAYRAYIVMEDVPGEFTKMPGRRYIGMSVQGENETTGFDNIQLPNANSQKLIINGQLIIIRDGEMYNAQGVRF